MDIETITMNTKEARRAYLDYRRAIKSRYGSVSAASEADATMMRAYRELARGQQVLDIVTVMRSVGVVGVGTPLPVLAICRADAKWCSCVVDHDGAAVFRQNDDGKSISWWQERKARASQGDVALPARTFEPYTGGIHRGMAMVPEVPIFLRPPHGLANYHILWEATWVPEPPADPLLLRHLGSTLYAVLAQWDLTPIEQAVLRGLRPDPRS